MWGLQPQLNRDPESQEGLWAPESGISRTKQRSQGPWEVRALVNVKRGEILDMGAPEQRPRIPSVTESRVGLLTAQNLIKRQGWWKGKFVLLWMLATGVGWWGCLSKGQLPPTDGQPVGKSFYRWRGGGYMQKQHSQL